MEWPIFGMLERESGAGGGLSPLKTQCIGPSDGFSSTVCGGVQPCRDFEVYIALSFLWQEEFSYSVKI